MRARSLAWLLAAAVVLLMAAPAAAQPGLKGDVALSYAMLYDKELPNNDVGINGFLPAGWLVSGSWHLIDSVSVVGEVGGSYKPISFMGTDVTLNIYNYMGGLRLSGPGVPLVSPFAQVTGVGDKRLTPHVPLPVWSAKEESAWPLVAFTVLPIRQPFCRPAVTGQVRAH